LNLLLQINKYCKIIYKVSDCKTPINSTETFIENGLMYLRVFAFKRRNSAKYYLPKLECGIVGQCPTWWSPCRI